MLEGSSFLFFSFSTGNIFAFFQGTGLQPVGSAVSALCTDTPVGVIRLSHKDFNHVVLFHLQRLRGMVVLDTLSVEEEAKGDDGNADTLRVGLLELTHPGGLLHAEVEFSGVLADHLQLDGIVTPCLMWKCRSS